MELKRTEIDAMLARADEVRAKLRRATRELMQFGEKAVAARIPGRRRRMDRPAAAAKSKPNARRSR